MIDDASTTLAMQNEIKKNKSYHLAHTEAVRFLLKISTYLARLHRFILTPPRPPSNETAVKNAAERKGRPRVEYENYNCQLYVN